MAQRSSGLVYSTESGRMCPGCRRALAACLCGRAAAPPQAGAVRVFRETKGRGGKSVTVVKGVPLPPDELSALGKRLRAACGSGGTVKDGAIEIQGDHCERVMALLVAEGLSPKRSGG